MKSLCYRSKEKKEKERRKMKEKNHYYLRDTNKPLPALIGLKVTS